MELSSPELNLADVAEWTARPFEELFALSRVDTERSQLEALRLRFDYLRPRLVALAALAARQGVRTVESHEQAAVVLFDHRVYKSYPMSLIENPRFEQLTAWLGRLTMHDLSAIPMDDVSSVDAWLNRLDEYGMIMLHTTGTTGKLSFLPRSRTEWTGGWQHSYFESLRAATGVDFRIEGLPFFYPGYRRGHNSGVKIHRIFGELSVGGDQARHCLYDREISSDLLALAARLRLADERGELETLDLDPRLLEERQKVIEAGRHRDEDIETWLTKLAEDFRGQRVRINGITAELVRMALKAQERGLRLEFAPDSVLFTSGGLKGMKDAPADWERLLMDVYGIRRLSSIYAMTESMGYAPLCSAGYYHFLPYTVPLLLDSAGRVLPRAGVQTGRFAFFDLLAASYWGGFVTGDRVTVYWDEDCECGWNGPRVDRQITRFSELEGGDDKITCAGNEHMYNEFMDYVSRI